MYAAAHPDDVARLADQVAAWPGVVLMTTGHGFDSQDADTEVEEEDCAAPPPPSFFSGVHTTTW